MVAIRAVCVATLLAVPVVAQTTWTVRASGGAQFTSLAAAVAAASPGDTILVQQPAMLEAVVGFTTDKGLTIVGEGGAVPIATTATPIEVVGLPAGQRFRMAGFTQIQNGELRVRVQNCQGEVHLDNLRCREPDLFGPQGASIRIDGCDSVTLRDVETFGVPAVWISTSRVTLTLCRLGLIGTGVGGGTSVWIDGASDVDVVEPRFDSGGTAVPIGVGDLSMLRVRGSTAAYVRSRSVFGVGTPVMTAASSAVSFDPAVQLAPGLYQPLFDLYSGVSITMTSLPGSWCGRALPGQILTLQTSAPVGSGVFQVIGRPMPAVATPLGPLAIDPTLGYLFSLGSVVQGSGQVDTGFFLPPSLPLGETFATQAIVLDGSDIRLGAPVVFTVH